MRRPTIEETWLSGSTSMPVWVQLGLWRKLSGVQRERAAEHLSVDAAQVALGEEREWAVIGALARRIGHVTDALSALDASGAHGGVDAATRLWVELAAGDTQSRSDVLLEACASEEGRRGVVRVLNRLANTENRWREKLTERAGIGASGRSDACLVRNVPVGLLWELCEHDAVLHRSEEVSDAALLELVAEPFAGRLAAGEQPSVDDAWKLAALAARGEPGEGSRELVEQIAHEQVRAALRAWVDGRVWIGAPWPDSPVDAVAAACAWRWMRTSETVARAHDTEIISMIDELAWGVLPLVEVFANEAWLPRQRALLLGKLSSHEIAKVVAQWGVRDTVELVVAIAALLEDDEKPLVAEAAALYRAQSVPVRARITEELGVWRFGVLTGHDPTIGEDLEVLVSIPARTALDAGDAGVLVAWAAGELGGDEGAWAALMAVLEANPGLSLAEACAAAVAASR